MTYRQFTEYSDHEGEHWHFWLSESGNREQLKRLEDYLANWVDEEPEFYFEGRHLTEAEVDLLVEFSDGNYMPSHQKVDGYLSLPAELEEYDPARWFYKGGIKGHFHES
jgi:hypothetical protein